MRAGDLRHKITFQERSTAQDAAGGQIIDWTDVITIWGQIRALSGREIIAAKGVQSETSHEITVRHQDEISVPKKVAAMRIVYDNRIFNIQSASNLDERKRVIVIQCSEGLNDG